MCMGIQYVSVCDDSLSEGPQRMCPQCPPENEVSGWPYDIRDEAAFPQVDSEARCEGCGQVWLCSTSPPAHPPAASTSLEMCSR